MLAQTSQNKVINRPSTSCFLIAVLVILSIAPAIYSAVLSTPLLSSESKSNRELSTNGINTTLEDDLNNSTESKLIRFTVSNLDGIEGRDGTFYVRAHPSWSPLGVDRFETLVRSSFWTECRFFRVIPGFVAQFGLNGDINVQQRWADKNLPDEALLSGHSGNTRGTVSFATSGKNTRTTQLFINLQDNPDLNSQGFTPIAEVVGDDGMAIVDRMYSGYEDKPNQQMIQREGNAYLEKNFPQLTYISKADFVDDDGSSAYSRSASDSTSLRNIIAGSIIVSGFIAEFIF